MLGILVIGLTVFMIITLVKNALFGKQLSADDVYLGSSELIIPLTSRSEFYIEPWMRNLASFSTVKNFRIHILIDNEHPAVIAWTELAQKLPFVELHVFRDRPVEALPVPWMLSQIAPKLSSDVVIIGDAELVPTEFAVSSLSKLVVEKNRPVFALPQTAKLNILGESVALLNPTLALASVFGFRKFRKNVSYPLMSIAQGWIGMPKDVFQRLSFRSFQVNSWKEALSMQWDQERISYILAFGERHLLRYYPEDFKVQVFQLKTYWEELWAQSDRTGMWLFLVTLLIWSFPVIFILSHPFWSLASFVLLVLYRFFSKIVFQESWGAAILHPVAAVVWLSTFVWWGVSGMKAKYRTRK